MTDRISDIAARVRLFTVLARPAVVVLLALFAFTGMAAAGDAVDRWTLTRVLVVVLGFLVFSVACNDIADEAIDRINLPGDAQRPLASGLSSRRDMVVVGCAGGVLAIAAAATLGWPVVVAVSAGLALAAAYSLRPVRVADRGALASMLLPAAYVALPYLVGTLSVRSDVSLHDLTLLAGLYAGFIGRILLKDFRDVRGDALFGKRTFLIRHGRRPTCMASAVFWTIGSAGIADAGPHGATTLTIEAVSLITSLVLLQTLAGGAGVLRGARRPTWRRDTAVIATLAIIGRSTITVLLLALTTAHWPAPARDAALIGFAGVVGVQALRMLRRGPTATLKLPASFQLTPSGSDHQLNDHHVEANLTEPSAARGPQTTGTAAVPVRTACASIGQSRTSPPKAAQSLLTDTNTATVTASGSPNVIGATTRSLPMPPWLGSITAVSSRIPLVWILVPITVLLAGCTTTVSGHGTPSSATRAPSSATTAPVNGTVPLTMTVTGVVSGQFTDPVPGAGYNCHPAAVDSPFVFGEINGQLNGVTYRFSLSTIDYPGPGQQPEADAYLGRLDQDPSQDYFAFGQNNLLTMPDPVSGTFSVDLIAPGNTTPRVHLSGQFHC